MARKSTAGCLVLVDPTHGLSHGLREAHQQPAGFSLAQERFSEKRGKLIVGNHIDELADFIEALLFRGVIDRQRERRCVDLAGGQSRVRLRRSADDEKLVIARILQPFDLQHLPERKRHTGSQTYGSEGRATQIVVGLVLLGRHDRLGKSVDDAADHYQIESLFDGGNRRVGGAPGDFQRTSGQRLNTNVGRANDHQIDIESLAFEETHLRRNPQRTVAERLGRRANTKLDFFLGAAWCSMQQKQHSRYNDRGLLHMSRSPFGKLVRSMAVR